MDPALREKIDRLPTGPGVYLMKGARGRHLYVGKAVNLRARVRSYFQRGGDGRAFIPYLDSLLHDLEVFLVGSAKEALILENELIKKHKPRFNVMLRDDKNFLHLRIEPAGPYPRVEVVRRMKDDSALYFGPFHSASAIRQTLRLVNKYFLLRTCTDHVLNNRKRPCLQYQIHRCLGPCVFPIDEAMYAEQVQDVIRFLEGKRDDLVEDLQRRMIAAAQRQSYELAGVYRDQKNAVEASLQRQDVVSANFADRDVFGVARAAGNLTLQVLQIRRGRFHEADVYHFDKVELPTGEALRSLLSQYYAGRTTDIPPEVVLPELPVDADTLTEWLSDRREGKVLFFRPARGERRRLGDLARKNAEHALAERVGRTEVRMMVLERLQKRLRLVRLPRRIECYDVSNLQGTGSVASMAVLTDGEVDKPAHRRFIIKSVQGQNDYAMLYEVLSRRFRRVVKRRESEGEQGEDPAEGSRRKDSFAARDPDLVLIDGGKGQLNVAVAVLRDLEITDVEVAALAKEREKDGPPDRVFLPGIKNHIPLRANTPELFVLARARDEAHRVAITYQRERRRKEKLRSALDEAPGIGPRRRARLLTHFGSLKRVKEASLQELAAAPGMGRKSAEALHDWLHPEGRVAEPL